MILLDDKYLFDKGNLNKCMRLKNEELYPILFS